MAVNKKKEYGAKVNNIFELAAYSAILGRAQLASVLGQSFEGSRDIYQALGYDTQISWQQYVGQYARQGFAKAVIDRPVASTWGRGFQLVEAGDDEETQLEKAWKDLEKRLGMISMFSRLDRLAGLGTYGILLLGLSDVSTPQDFRKPTTGRSLQLKYVKPFSGMANEGDAQIQTWVTDPSNERYGRPELYSVTLRNLSTGDSQILSIHYSRVIHVADGLGSSEIEGTPRLESIFNNLKNLEKITGGSAEMYWRGARPGYGLEADKDFQITDAILEDLQGQLDEFEHNLRRVLALQGMKVNPMAQQVADPASAVDVQIQEISATTGIPKRILTGSERGELASSQDRENQADYIEDRQLNFAELRIIRATVDRFIELGILPPASTEEGYSIQWPDTREPSDKDRADVGKVRADAIKSYASAPTAEAVMPIQSFLRLCLGLTEDEIVLVEEEKAAVQAEEEAEQAQMTDEERAAQEAEEAAAEAETKRQQREEVPVNPNQPVVQSNPCHNPAGSAGGQFCTTPGGGSNKELSGKEKESLVAYQRTNYPEVNGHLRGTMNLHRDDKAIINDYIKNLDSIFKKANEVEVNVFRGTDAEFTRGIFEKTGILKELKGAKVEGITNSDKPPAGFSTWDKYFNARLSGTTFQDKGFTSTSSKEKVTKGFVSRRYEDPRNGVSSICNIRGSQGH